MKPIAKCNVCEPDEESIRHVLCGCTVARAFWDQTKELICVRLPELHPVTRAWDLLVGGSAWREAKQ
jgi:hypothetical protein